MCWQAERVLFCDWAAPRQARGFCTDHLIAVLGYGVEADETITAATQIVSELVTNAVNSDCTSADIQIALHRDHVRIAVADNAAGLPVQLDPDADDPHGRGLIIVDRLARSWGTLPRADGKSVWAVISVPPQLTTGMSCTVSTLM
jgi:signal transduction histidine kinase